MHSEANEPHRSQIAPLEKKEIASQQIFRKILRVGVLSVSVLSVVAFLVCLALGGQVAAFSALFGTLFAAVFMGVTLASILAANKFFGKENFVLIFFAFVLGGWLLKFSLFLLSAVLLKDQVWLNKQAFFTALMVGVLVTLVIDVVVISRSRISVISDAELPRQEHDREK